MWLYFLLLLLTIAFIQVIKFLIVSLRICWRYLRGNQDTRQALQLLLQIYKPWAVCLKKIIEYSPQTGVLKARMHAPKDYSYTWFRPECVTGIHYDLALSELAYVFICSLIRDGVATLITDQEFALLKENAGEIIAWEKEFKEKEEMLAKIEKNRKAERRNLKEQLVEVRKIIRVKKNDFSVMLWRNPPEAEEAFFRKIHWSRRPLLKWAYYSKNWFESFFWRPFSPEGILTLNRQELETLLFERLMEKYKLVFLAKDVVYIKRTMLAEDFEISLELKKHLRHEKGFPLTIIKVGGGAMIGSVKNAALLNEVKA